mmetsp:Transcript_25238/g.88028  ORF Transcript_25238/g.88028 Transcript_25238/m.88028 type:complete len:313 (+) Transcript_25238:311-1249(+)
MAEAANRDGRTRVRGAHHSLCSRVRDVAMQCREPRLELRHDHTKPLLPASQRGTPVTLGSVPPPPSRGRRGGGDCNGGQRSRRRTSKQRRRHCRCRAVHAAVGVHRRAVLVEATGRARRRVAGALAEAVFDAVGAAHVVVAARRVKARDLAAATEHRVRLGRRLRRGRASSAPGALRAVREERDQLPIIQPVGRSHGKRGLLCRAMRFAAVLAAAAAPGFRRAVAGACRRVRPVHLAERLTRIRVLCIAACCVRRPPHLPILPLAVALALACRCMGDAARRDCHRHGKQRGGRKRARRHDCTHVHASGTCTV